MTSISHATFAYSLIFVIIALVVALILLVVVMATKPASHRGWFAFGIMIAIFGTIIVAYSPPGDTPPSTLSELIAETTGTSGTVSVTKDEPGYQGTGRGRWTSVKDNGVFSYTTTVDRWLGFFPYRQTVTVQVEENR